MILIVVLCAVHATIASASFTTIDRFDCLDFPELSFFNSLVSQEEGIAGIPGFVAYNPGSVGPGNALCGGANITVAYINSWRVVEEFSLSGLSTQQNYVISIQWNNGILGGLPFPDEYAVFIYAGDGIQIAEDWFLGDLLGTYPIPAQGGGTTIVDVTDVLVDLISQGQQYLGVSLRVAEDNLWPGIGASHALEDMTLISLPVQVGIDIEPRKDGQIRNPTSGGKVEVAILTTGAFDAMTVNGNTLAFGPNNAAPTRVKTKDIDRDDDLDLVASFEKADTGIQCGDTEATLTGQTNAAGSFEGTDSIITIGKRCQ